MRFVRVLGVVAGLSTVVLAGAAGLSYAQGEQDPKSVLTGSVIRPGGSNGIGKNGTSHAVANDQDVTVKDGPAYAVSKGEDGIGQPGSGGNGKDGIGKDAIAHVMANDSDG